MKMLKFLLLIGLLTIVSCSKGSKKNTTASNEADFIESEADFIVDADDEDLIIDDGTLLAEEPTEFSDAQEAQEILALDDSIASSPAMSLSDEEGSYTVKKGETLMMVAFNIYGDYRRWKNIANLNGVQGDGVSEGAVLKYRKPSSEFIWNPEGLPYLIKRGDSLGTISNDKYGTQSKWRLIYNNNRPLIKDPNLIFAGFTLYYIPERDIASE